METDYLPGYDLKATYQRNMLYGMLLAGLVALVGGAMVLLANPSLTAHRPAAPRQASFTSEKIAQTSTASTGGSSLRGLNPYAGRHRGFLGFRRLNVAPQNPNLPDVDLPRATSLEPGGPILDGLGFPASGNEGYGHGAGEGDGWGVYLPMSDEYFLPADSEAPAFVGDREMQVLTQVDPKYPRVALDRRLEGRIAVLVFVDARGFLAPFPDWLKGERRSLRCSVDGLERTFEYTMTEDPADWFFGANFLKVLPQWQFIPRIENGDPVGAPLIIKYSFCINAGCLKYELVPVPGQ